MSDHREEDKEEDVNRGDQAEKEFREHFDLNVALDALEQDSEKAMKQLLKDEAQLTKYRQSIQQQSRKNFVLERELAVIGEKIGLLVKNRITVAEAAKAFMKDEDEKDATQSPIQGRRDHYETLFYILQSKPRYFAKLTRLIGSRDVPSFVQTVVFDMYGDQYDTREERLLLDLFKRVLKDELDAAENRGSLLRANTCITQMLSAYAKRGQGMAILKEILGPPLKDLTSNHKDLNLEIDPGKVYRQYIQDVETKTGKKCDWPVDVDPAEAAARPEIAAILKEREQQLIEWCGVFLQRILDGVDQIPFGMRWICKQLGSMCKERFPDSTRYQVGSLMGGYIYLRFFNPVIVNPDGLNLIKNKPTRHMRRNLIMIAKVLQNLSNGLEFGDKEAYMKSCNAFIENKKEALLDYFDRLVEVEDLSDALQVDKYLEHTAQGNNITLSYNQIFLVHRLCQEHLEKLVSSGSDPIRSVMKDLGPGPPDVPRDENRTVILQLMSRKQRLSTAADAFAIQNKEVNPLYFQAKALLLSVLRLLPSETSCTTLETFLEAEKRAAVKAEDSSLADHITNVVSMLHTLAGMGLLRDMGSTTDTFNFFLWEIASDAMDRQRRIPLVKKRLMMVKPAVQNIQQHHDALMLRLDMYKTYLANVRKGAGNTIVEKEEKEKAKKKDKKTKILEHKANHNDLVNDGIIMSIDPSISEAVLKKCYYLFKMPEPGKFEITLHIKKGFDIQLLKKPIVLVLEDLLTMQEHGETRLPLEYLDLNVNLLIHMLNTKFVAKS